MKLSPAQIRLLLRFVRNPGESLRILETRRAFRSAIVLERLQMLSRDSSIDFRLMPLGAGALFDHGKRTSDEVILRAVAAWQKATAPEGDPRS